MKIKFSALGGGVRIGWLQVVVHVSDPSFGFGSIKARALPQLHFDTLWSDLQTAIAENEEKPTPANTEAKNQAQEAIVRAMVIGHEPLTFAAEFAAPSTEEETTDLLESLVQMGFSVKEASAGLKAGKLTKPFATEEIEVGPEGHKVKYTGASVDTVRFYRYCQPMGIFLLNLLNALYAYQHGSTRSPQEIWEANAPKGAEGVVPFPLPLARRKE